MNVLLTCAGRRNYLVKFFQEALKNRGQVFASDFSADAAALQEADKSFVLPLVKQSDYFDKVAQICEEYQIRLLIPLIDLELPLLAKQRERFLKIGTLPVISSPTVVDICYDKWATFEFLSGYGLAVPKTYLSLAEARKALIEGIISFPLMVKPRWGSASVGVVTAEDDDELDIAYRFVSKHIPRTSLADANAIDAQRCILIQERLSGQEHGLDIVNDLEGNHVTTFVKRKLSMVIGETDRAITVEDEKLKELGHVIGQKLGHIGNLDCDVIVNQNGCYVIDMNPRFGGGYPFSHMAGANLPAALIAWANGEKPDMSWLKVEANIMSSKCDRLVTNLRNI
ncbi:hypothetical protein NIES4074_03750 [Cylindrospermum sp. NIES-4074]|nr:hypothetical protein NIES4074_03750 [Cylindrospermum sp. NIES-4074]